LCGKCVNENETSGVGLAVTYIGELEAVLADKESEFDHGSNGENDKDEHNGADDANAGAGCHHFGFENYLTGAHAERVVDATLVIPAL